MGIYKILKGLSKTNLKKTYCPKCDELQPKVRKPKNIRQALWGGNTCKNCGCEMGRFGKEMVK